MQKITGIPQNRERVFIVSIRNDMLQTNFCFPPKMPLICKLKDLLENTVDEKYYLSERGIGRLIKKDNKLIRSNENPNISSCIIAGYHKMSGRNNQYISENVKVNRIGGLYDNKGRTHQAGSIYNSDGLSPTLTTMNNGGNKQPFVLVREGTKKGYTEAMEGDSINYSYPNSTTKRGRVGKGISQTILTSSNIATLEKIDTEREMFNPYNNRKITDIAPTQTTNCGSTTSSATVLVSENGKQYMRIRKLTPLECWRLMGFDDADFYKAKSAGISDTQLYRQAGNSIVVNVLEFILEELLCQSKLEKCA